MDELYHRLIGRSIEPGTAGEMNQLIIGWRFFIIINKYEDV